MSVYTQLNQQDFEFICQRFGLGTPISYKGVADGIENTTYFFTTKQSVTEDNTPSNIPEPQEWVFTLFEYTKAEHLPYYLDMYVHLAEQGIPVPAPLTVIDDANNHLITLYDKPGTVFPRLPGTPPKQITESLCFECGEALARFHIAGASYQEHHDCPKGLDFWQSSLSQFEQLTTEDKALIQSVIDDYLKIHEGLTKTSVHGDLFHDNVLAQNNHLTAIIDLFNASYDYAVFDLAITLNDWSISEDSLTSDYQINKTFHDAMIRGYQSQRPLSDAEQIALPVMQQAAALRFWLSRIDTALSFENSDSEETSSKDPEQMKRLLMFLKPRR